MKHNKFMSAAISMRERAIKVGDQAYGAVIVKDGKIVGFGPSRVIAHQDPTAHAEMEALRDAASKLGSQGLQNCILYSTSPPCAMCEAGAYWAGISKMISTANLRNLGKPKLRRC